MCIYCINKYELYGACLRISNIAIDSLLLFNAHTHTHKLFGIQMQQDRVVIVVVIIFGTFTQKRAHKN